MPIVSTKGTPLEVTTLDGYPVTISSSHEDSNIAVLDYAHHETHEGNHYVASNTVDLGNGASRNYIIVSPDTTVQPHAIFNVMTELEGDGAIWEGVTYAAPGTAITAYNRNRRSSNTATLLVYHTPTTPSTAAASQIQVAHWGSGRSIGGEVRGSAEFILKRNTAYMVTITNATTNNNYITFWVDWYEHSD